jgi:hypothetical protein
VQTYRILFLCCGLFVKPMQMTSSKKDLSKQTKKLKLNKNKKRKQIAI